MIEKLEGYVEHIIFRNTENGYTVFELYQKPENICCVGILPNVNEGEYLELEGEYTFHNVYGEQFKISRFNAKIPKEQKALEKYLGSGAIRGIGAKLAERILERFGEDTLRILEEEPERLAEIKGISRRMARDIAVQMEEKSQMQNEMIFLTQYGISLNLCQKIRQKYHDRIYDIMQYNPYKLAEDISGIGFKTADMIAARAGIKKDSPFRIKSGYLYVLGCALGEGSIYLPKNVLDQRTSELLELEPSELENCFTDLIVEKRLIAKQAGEDRYGNKIVNVYTYQNYYLELSVAAKLRQLNVVKEYGGFFGDGMIGMVEEESGLSLDEMQREAVECATRHGILILTGGPGTGKTTTINIMIRFFKMNDEKVLLAAPTGRAAKRMQEATGYEASTIHRMLEQYGDPEDPSEKVRFGRNIDKPLDADVIIIDETSMVDIFLMNALLNAVVPGTRLIFVGDVNQLPSVGPGRVLQDMIDSDAFRVIRLTKIFRQAAQSSIVVNAHKINDGEYMNLSANSGDFFFFERDNILVIQKIVVRLVMEKLPGYLNVESRDIQVLTPMRKGPLGVETLNALLQKYINPPSEEKDEHEYGSVILRTGDKVMQVKNDYQLSWEIRGMYDIVVDRGEGVFNGDMGVIKEINGFMETVTVEFDDMRTVVYDFKQLDELELAYAVTVHKSQGSEYSAVVMPVLNGPRMLFTRNLLYTAVTRAKNLVALVGSAKMINAMTDNVTEDGRYTSLEERIREIP
jgi:exodeoxyribonuclease V alpha subunit